MVQLLESPEIRQIVVVVTKFDMLRERDKVKLMNFLKTRIPERVRARLEARYSDGDPIFQKYEMIFKHLPIFGVSSLDALQARLTNDEELFAASGFRELNERLPELILTGQNNSTILRATQTVRRITKELDEQIPRMSQEAENQKKECGAARQEFARLTYERAETLMEAARIRIFEILNAFSEQKTIVTKAFIAALSEIRELDAAVIEQALQQQAERSQAQLDETLDKEVYPAVEAVIQQEMQDQWTALIDQLSGAVSALGLKAPDILKQIETLKTDLPALAPAAGTPFFWSSSPVPPRVRMLDIHLINEVRQGIETSVDAAIQNLKNAETQRLKALCTQAADALEPLVVAVYEQMQQQIQQFSELELTLSQPTLTLAAAQLAAENEQLEQRFLCPQAQAQSAQPQAGEPEMTGGECHECR